MITAIAALSFPSTRGGVSSIITFNFDDLLEQSLTGCGVCVEPIWRLPKWQSRADVRIYHPHGYLPQNPKMERSARIVLAQKDFDQIIADVKDLWKNALLEILATHTCLFIGLSGSDKNLSSLLSLVKDGHVSRIDAHPYWGLRLGERETVGDLGWKARGVKVVNLGSHKQIPEFLREICRLAAESR